VRDWALTLRRGSSVLDLGCGTGLPITKVLVDQGLEVFAVDAAPSLVAAFRSNFPQVPVACESVLESAFFDRTFGAVISWGLMFLLQPDEQRSLIARIGDALEPGGRLLFTAEARPVAWNDAMTGLESRSLGADEYRKLLAAEHISVTSEYEDRGQNYYFDAYRVR
jgi:SAM-dependent methyltransferase